MIGSAVTGVEDRGFYGIAQVRVNSLFRLRFAFRDRRRQSGRPSLCMNLWISPVPGPAAMVV
jgi:hypothetical protein